jgi:hypothetical protein
MANVVVGSKSWTVSESPTFSSSARYRGWAYVGGRPGGGRRDPDRWQSSPWIRNIGGPRPIFTEWSSVAPRDVKARARLYSQIWSRKFFDCGSVPVKSARRGSGGGWRHGRRTVLWSQHMVNFGSELDEPTNFSACQWRASQSRHSTSIRPRSWRWCGSWYGRLAGGEATCYVVSLVS